MDFCEDYQYKQHIKDGTRITHHSNTILDLIITNIEHVAETGVHDTVISDHLPVYLVKKKDREEKEFKTNKGRPKSQYNKEIFQQFILNHHQWYIFWTVTTVADKWKTMHHIILDSLNKALPVKTFKIRKNSPSWFMKDILELLKIKHSSFLAAKLGKTNIHLWDAYKKAKHAANRAVRDGKRKYIRETLNSNRHDPKSFWKEINSLLGQSKSSDKCIKTIRRWRYSGGQTRS